MTILLSQLCNVVSFTECKIYADSARTDLKDTLSVAQGSTSFQFIHSAFTRSGTNTNDSTGKAFDLDLQETVVVTRRRVGFGAGRAMRR